MCITLKLKTPCIRGHVYILNVIAIYQMCTITDMRSAIKEADPKNWRFSQDPRNGGFRMLLSQSVKLPAATNVSSLCVIHVMQSQPGNSVSCFQ